MRIVPRPAKGTFTHNLGLGRPVVGNHLGRVDVDAVFVGECGVGALPSGDATPTVAEREGGFGDVERAEAVEEICFTGYDDVVEVGVSKLADIDLEKEILAIATARIFLVGKAWGSTHSILPAVESAGVESCVGSGDSYCMGRSVRVWRVLVSEVDVVRPEISRAKGRVVRYGETTCSGSCQRCVERWPNSQDARIDLCIDCSAAVWSLGYGKEIPENEPRVLGSFTRVS